MMFLVSNVIFVLFAGGVLNSIPSHGVWQVLVRTSFPLVFCQKLL